jgi:hypothetical protein
MKENSPAIEITGLTRRHGKVEAVNGFSLAVPGSAGFQPAGCRSFQLRLAAGCRQNSQPEMPALRTTPRRCA